MLKKMIHFIFFCLAVIAIVGGLKLMNWVPSAFQEGFLREYASTEDVKARLKIPHVYVPAYYPQGLKWPPLRIAAQTRPYTAVVMEFVQKGLSEVCLVISQTEIPHPPPLERIRLATVKEAVKYNYKGRQMLLEVGTCSDGSPCSRLSWEEAGYRITAASRSTPVDLVKIGESMIPAQDGRL